MNLVGSTDRKYIEYTIGLGTRIRVKRATINCDLLIANASCVKYR